MDNPLIRPATRDDLPAINDIYNHYVLISTCTYQVEPELMSDRVAWFESHDPRHPIIVAESGRQVVGWGSLSTFNQRVAYARTAENSVYVRHDLQRRGIGRALLSELIAVAARFQHHSIMAVISADQVPSVKLHEAFGFTQVARLKEVGFKFDQWLDVVYLQLMLK